MKDKGNGNLGRSIIRARFKGARPRDDDTSLHTTELNDGAKWTKYQSITELRDLDDFLATAELAGTEFAAEKLNVKVVSAANPFILTAEQEKRSLALQDENKSKLTVPRRPKWDEKTTADKLHELERQSFLNWRKELATLQENEDLIMTPFERNIEVWRQLWRVLERSDIIVQIVDARNPLLFRSVDLEVYAKEVDPNKKNLLLINKADMLTPKQRLAWANYFDRNGIAFVFFSAALAKKALEKEAKQEQLRSLFGENMNFEDKDDQKQDDEDAIQGLAETEARDQEMSEQRNSGGADQSMEDDSTDVKTTGEEQAEEQQKNGHNNDNDDDDDDDDDDDGKEHEEEEDEEGTSAAENGDDRDQTEQIDDDEDENADEQEEDDEEEEEEEGEDEGEEDDRQPSKSTSSGAKRLAESTGSSVHKSQGDMSSSDQTKKPTLQERKEAIAARINIKSSTQLFEHIMRLCPPKDEFDAQGHPRLTIGLVGYPNVGKSSTINALCGAKRVAVGATPGKTKHFQTIIVGDGICLCDCPGLVFPSFATTKAEMVCNGILPIDQLREYIGPSTLVAQRIPRDILERTYGIALPLPSEEEDANAPPTAAELLSTYARARGFMRSFQGNPDEARAARYILKDYMNGKLIFNHPPPRVDPAKFNEQLYQRIRKKLDRRKPEVKHDGDELKEKRPMSSVDQEWFHQSEVVVKSKGINTGNYTRTQFPYQSSSSAASQPQSQGKKHFKKDKRRK